ncbi:MAG TPA: hypothetical protein VM492_06810 [Sumerlaeia bacterium]|nr:hypothetical protein [Sumerlaeia bacterium]
MNEKIVMIGAGSVSFTQGLVGDMIARGWEGEIGLVDIDADALAVAENLVRKMLQAKAGGAPAKGARMKLAASKDRRDLLPDATVVITTIGVGGRRAWEQDVFVPRKYGIYQPVGDTVMPGGASRALRMIPDMVDIARDVCDLAPNALFFNYANPMSPVCRAVRKATGAEVVGLCHGVFHVGHFLADTLGAAREDVKYTAIGINHLTWFTELRVRGEDAMPRLREIAAEKMGRTVDPESLGKRFAEAGTLDRADSGADLDNPFTWELVDLFGAFPAVLDRHVTEFFPHLFAKKGSYYGRTLGVEAFSFEGTIAAGDNGFAAMRETAFSPEPLGEDFFQGMSGEHEQAVDIIESIRADAGRAYSANLPNRGQVPNLPAEAVIECPAVAGASGMRPLAQPPIDAALAGTLATRFQWVETVVDAALEGSRRKFIQALLLDGAVESIGTAARLADDLLEAQAERLPRFWRGA